MRCSTISAACIRYWKHRWRNCGRSRAWANSQALLLSLMNDVARYYQVDRTMQGENSSHGAGLRGISGAVLLRTERGNGVSAVSGRQMQGAVLQEVGQGSVNSAGISVRKIVETALAANATTVVLAHNHPSGIAVPSSEDVQTTCRVAMALNAVEIQLARPHRGGGRGLCLHGAVGLPAG